MKKPAFSAEFYPGAPPLRPSGRSVVTVNGISTGPLLRGGDAIEVSMWLKQAWAELMRNAKTPPLPKDVEGRMAMEGF